MFSVRFALRFTSFTITESKLGKILFGHQVVVHTALQVGPALLPAGGIIVVVRTQTAHIVQHQFLALAFVVQRKASLLRCGWNELFLTKGHRRHLGNELR